MSDADTLTRIEERLARIEAKLEQAERAILPVLANPGKLLARIMGGGK
jgi:hypothetical protein